MSEHFSLQAQVVLAAIAACENAAYLPDGNAQIPTELCETLGSALSALSEFEAELYAEHLRSLDTPIWGFDKQIGLNAAQVALQRMSMSSEQLALEQAIDLADKLYVDFFDEVIIPGVSYVSLPIGQTKEVRYVFQESIDSFSQAANAVSLSPSDP